MTVGLTKRSVLLSGCVSENMDVSAHIVLIAAAPRGRATLKPCWNASRPRNKLTGENAARPSRRNSPRPSFARDFQPTPRLGDEPR